MSDTTYLICRNKTEDSLKSTLSGDNQYEIRPVFPGESWKSVKDEESGEMITLIIKDGNTVDSAGEFCGHTESIREARITRGRLVDLAEIMEEYTAIYRSDIWQCKLK